MKVEGPSHSNMSDSSQGQSSSIPSSNSPVKIDSYSEDHQDTAQSSSTSVSHDGDHHMLSFHERALGTAQAQIRATFYPKFENEKSDQEVLFSVVI